VRILVVDDHELLRRALARLLMDFGNVSKVYQASDGAEAVSLACEVKPDLVLMDLRMPRCNGLEAIRLLKQKMPRCKILVLTVSDSDDDLVYCLKAGAQGYLLKNTSPDEFRRAIQSVFSGDGFIVPSMASRVLHGLLSGEESQATILTGRERALLALVAEGASNAEIAARLHISTHTVKAHVGNLMEKLQLKNRVQLAVYAVEAGLAPGAGGGHARLGH